MLELAFHAILLTIWKGWYFEFLTFKCPSKQADLYNTTPLQTHYGPLSGLRTRLVRTP